MGAPLFGRHALSAGRLAALGATPDFHHGLLVRDPEKACLGRVREMNNPTTEDTKERRWQVPGDYAIRIVECRSRPQGPLAQW